MIYPWKSKHTTISSTALRTLRMKSMGSMSLIHMPMRKRVKIIPKSNITNTTRKTMTINMRKRIIPTATTKKTPTISMKITIHNKITTTKNTRKTPIKRIASSISMMIMSKNHLGIASNLLTMTLRINCMRDNLAKI